MTDRTKRGTTSAQPEPDISKDRAPSKAHENHSCNDEHATEWVVSRIGEGDTLRYVGSWYGYERMTDTLEPEHRIPQVISVYWPCIDEMNK